MNNNIVTFDRDKIALLAKEGSNLVFDKDAEIKLIEFLKFKEQVDSLYEEIKLKIEASGSQIMPNFKGVWGDKVRCMYRAYGSKYKIDDPIKAAPFIVQTLKEGLDGEKIDEYLKEKGTYPEGISSNIRDKKLSISIKEQL